MNRVETIINNILEYQDASLPEVLFPTYSVWNDKKSFFLDIKCPKCGNIETIKIQTKTVLSDFDAFPNGAPKAAVKSCKTFAKAGVCKKCGFDPGNQMIGDRKVKDSFPVLISPHLKENQIINVRKINEINNNPVYFFSIEKAAGLIETYIVRIFEINNYEPARECMRTFFSSTMQVDCLKSKQEWYVDSWATWDTALGNALEEHLSCIQHFDNHDYTKLEYLYPLQSNIDKILYNMCSMLHMPSPVIKISENSEETVFKFSYIFSSSCGFFSNEHSSELYEILKRDGVGHIASDLFLSEFFHVYADSLGCKNDKPNTTAKIFGIKQSAVDTAAKELLNLSMMIKYDRMAEKDGKDLAFHFAIEQRFNPLLLSSIIEKTNKTYTSCIAEIWDFCKEHSVTPYEAAEKWNDYLEAAYLGAEPGYPMSAIDSERGWNLLESISFVKEKYVQGIVQQRVAEIVFDNYSLAPLNEKQFANILLNTNKTNGLLTAKIQNFRDKIKHSKNRVFTAVKIINKSGQAEGAALIALFCPGTNVLVLAAKEGAIAEKEIMEGITKSIPAGEGL